MKKKYGGSGESIFGTLQIEPFRFYISRDVSDEIRASGKEFQDGTLYAENAMDIIKKFVSGKNLYSSFDFSHAEIYRIINTSRDAMLYDIYLRLDPTVHLRKVQKGLFFKREVEEKIPHVQLKKYSQKLIKILCEKCEREGIDLTGIEILTYNIIDGDYYEGKRYYMQDFTDAFKGSRPSNYNIFVHWRYKGKENLEQTSKFDVIIVFPGSNKSRVAMVIREMAGVELKRAKELANSYKTVKSGLTKEEAWNIAKRLREVGATVAII